MRRASEPRRFAATASASPRKSREDFFREHTGRGAERQITFLNFL
jgi:hypothetical protein